MYKLECIWIIEPIKTSKKGRTDESIIREEDEYPLALIHNDFAYRRDHEARELHDRLYDGKTTKVKVTFEILDE